VVERDGVQVQGEDMVGLEGVTLGMHSTVLKTILKGVQDRD
jgi:hypothetical protein